MAEEKHGGNFDCTISKINSNTLGLSAGQSFGLLLEVENEGNLSIGATLELADGRVASVEAGYYERKYNFDLGNAWMIVSMTEDEPEYGTLALQSPKTYQISPLGTISCKQR